MATTAVAGAALAVSRGFYSLQLPRCHVALRRNGKMVPSLPMRATSSPEEASSSIPDLKEKWDAAENKASVLLYGGAAVVALWLSSLVDSAISSVPLLPKLMQLIGVGYTGWFVYRYLLFKQNREELADGIGAARRKISGSHK